MLPYCELDDVLNLTTEDVDFLTQLSDKYNERKVGFHNKTDTGISISEFDSYQHYYIRRDEKADYKSNPFFQKITDVCHKIKKRNTHEEIFQAVQFAYVSGPLPFHKDPRDCVLSIPLNDIRYPLTFQEDDGTVICEYSYKRGMPVLLNTHVDHGCEQNGDMRKFCHISFNEDYEKIHEYLKGSNA
jgi:hypothetical protein